MPRPRYPSLFEIDTRAWLAELAAGDVRAATLGDVPDAALDLLAERGFDFVWLMGVWQTGEAARAISRAHPGWRKEFEAALPDFEEDDVCGSRFAVQAYRAHADFGGDDALARFRDRLRARGIGLILDFVPNHVAPDHAWVEEHPEYFVQGSEAQLAAAPADFVRVEGPHGPRILAYGRDPNFEGWPDTLQLDYANPDLQEAMVSELRRIADRCDGVRCDMAMLMLPEVFQRTWGKATKPFWPRAIEAVREARPGFLFLAEVYWDLEWTLQQQGFDYTYDKRLYDRLEAGEARPIWEHLLAGLDYQDHLARFLENHDEERAATAFAWGPHQAAAVLTYLTPGLRFFHRGQAEGRRIRIPVHLRRGPVEAPDPTVTAFYERLWRCLREPAFRDGDWQLLACRPAWDGNATWDDFIAFAWTGASGEKRLVAVNFSDHPSQCFVTPCWSGLDDGTHRLVDLMGTAVYERSGAELGTRGLYLDVPPWGVHVFALERVEDA